MINIFQNPIFENNINIEQYKYQTKDQSNLSASTESF